MKIDEAVEKLGVTRQTLLQWIHEGRIKAESQHAGGRERWRIPPAEVQRIAAEMAGRPISAAQERPHPEVLKKLERVERKLDQLLSITQTIAQGLEQIRGPVEDESRGQAKTSTSRRRSREKQGASQSTSAGGSAKRISAVFSTFWQGKDKRWYAQKKVQGRRITISVGQDRQDLETVERRIREYFARHPDKRELFLSKFPQFKSELGGS